jgi:hypothetical protein
MVFSFAGVIGRRAERLRDIICAMRNLLLALGIAACGGHAGTPATPTAPAAAAAYPATRWVPASPTYLVAAQTVRDGQRAMMGVLEDLGMATGMETRDLSRDLEQVLGVDPLSPEALSGIGVDLGGGVALFSEDVMPTFVVHLASPEAFQSFIDRQRGRGLVSVSTMVDGVELNAASIDSDASVSWGVDKDWLWVHFAPKAAGSEWFVHSHKAAGAAWASAWSWAEKMAGKAKVIGFARAQDLIGAVAARVENGKACLDRLEAVDKVGFAFDADGGKLDARLSFDVGANAAAMQSHLLAPPPGWATVAKTAPLAVQWNLDLNAVAAWWEPCARVWSADPNPFDQYGLRAARAFVLSIDPDAKDGSGAVALDLSSGALIAPYVAKASHFSSDKTFGPYKGHHVSIPFVAKLDYVFDGKIAIAAMGDGVMDRIAAGTPGAPPPVFALSLAPAGMAKPAWTWLLEQAGMPEPERLVDRLAAWQEAHAQMTIEGSSLVVDVGGSLR